MASLSMTEKRHTKRWQLFYYLRVFEAQTGELLGHVVDVTTEGMMLISEAAIPKGVVYDLRMELPGARDVSTTLNLRAQSRWSTCDVNKKFFDTGFTLVNPTQETVEAIQAIIDELQFPGPADSPEEDSRFALSKVVTR